MAEFKDTYAVDTTSDLSGLDKARGGLDSFAGAALGAVSAIGGLAVVQSVTGFIGDSITAGFEFEQQLNRIAGATGATGTELEEMKNIAHDVWEQGFGAAPEEVINAMTQVANITGATGGELQALTEDALALSATFGTDVTESTTTAQRIMQQFGVDGQTAMDMIAFSMQQTGDPSGDLMATIQEFAPVFAEMGYSAQGMFELLQSGNDAGIESFGKFADGIKEFNIRTLDGSDASEEAYNNLFATMDSGFTSITESGTKTFDTYAELQAGISDGSITMRQVMGQTAEAMQGITDPVERNAIGVALMGSLWEDLGPDILTAMDVAGDGMGDYEGAMDKVKQSTLNAIAPTERFKRSMQGFISQAVNPLIAAIIEELVPALDSFTAWLKGGGLDGIEEFVSSLIDSLIPIANDVIGFVTELTQEFIRFVNENPEVIAFVQKVAISLGIAYAAFVSIGAIVATVSGVIGGLGASLGVAAAAIAFILSPIGLLVAAIALLALAYQTNFLGFRDAVAAAIDYIVPKLNELYNWFVSTGLPAIQGALNTFVSDVWTPFRDGLGTIWETVSGGLQSLLNWFVADALPFIKLAMQIYMDNYITPLINLLAGIWNAVSVGLLALGDWFLSTGLPFIKLAVQTLMDNYITPFISLLAGIYGAVSVGLSLLKNWFTESGLPAMTTKIQEIIDKFNAFRDRANTIWDAISTAMNGMKTNFTEIFAAMISPIQDVIDMVDELINAISNIDFPDVTPDWVDDIVPGFAATGLIGAGGQGFAGGSFGGGGSGNNSPLIIQNHLYMDGQEIAIAVDRARAEMPSNGARPIPLRASIGVR